MSRISVTDDEARRYYAQHTKEFTTPSSLTLREILVKVAGDAKGVNVGLDEEAKQRAEAARARVLAGESFEKVAAEASEAPVESQRWPHRPHQQGRTGPDPSRHGGQAEGRRGQRGHRIQGGYYFFKLDSMSPTTVLSFEEARGQISDRVANEKRNVELQKYLQKLRALAIIEWKNAELKKLYDQRIATAASMVPVN